jgi:hypothetical protein
MSGTALYEYEYPERLIPYQPNSLPPDTIRAIVNDLNSPTGSFYVENRYTDLVLRLIEKGMQHLTNYHHTKVQNRDTTWRALQQNGYSLSMLVNDFRAIGAHTAARLLGESLEESKKRSKGSERALSVNVSDYYPDRLIRGGHNALSADTIRTIMNDLGSPSLDDPKHYNKYHDLVVHLIEQEASGDIKEYHHGKFQNNTDTWLCLQRAGYSLKSLAILFEVIGANEAAVALKTSLGITDPVPSKVEALKVVKGSESAVAVLRSRLDVGPAPSSVAPPQEDMPACCICFMGTSNMLPDGCEHIATCEECIKKINKCPVCNAPFKTYKRTTQSCIRS